MTKLQSKPSLEPDVKLLSQQYFLSLWDASTGGFRFAPHQPATLMATAYCVLGLEFARGLHRLSESQRTATIAFLMSRLEASGSFKEPLFHPEDVLSKEHNLAYFQEETTTFCQQALDALGAPPPLPRTYLDGRETAEGIIQFCESLPWEDAWLDSNPVMFALSQLCHDVERHNKPELLDTVDTALDWLDDHQSSKTGLWQGPHEVSLTNAMAATFHFTFYYGFRGRPLRYADRIIDSCLSLQESHGLFSGSAVGQTCLDYDAIDLLAKTSLTTSYRAEDVRAALHRAAVALLKLSNEDGGFANCKERIRTRSGRKAQLVKKLRLSTLIPLETRVSNTGQYSVCWKLLSCDNANSNAFSTWFRLIGMRLACQDEWLEDLSKDFTFRRLPFLGYHDPSAIRMSILK